MARRPLGPDEAALWAKVARTVRPLERAAPPPDLPRIRPIRDAGPPPPVAPVRAKAANGIAPEAASLDGGWDREIRRGRLIPDTTIDLHGHTADAARAHLGRRIVESAQAGRRVLLVITGKGATPSDDATADARPRGVIRAALARWLEEPELRPFVAALRPAHPKHGGAGAFYVILRRG